MTELHSGSDRSHTSGVFKREIAALPAIFQLVDRSLHGRRAQNELRYSIQFILEEIFTNLVKYNPTGQSDIRIDLSLDDDEVMMRITDGDAPRFDIRTDAKEVDANAPLDRRTPGGLGIHLVKKMVDRIDYTHENRTAVLTLYKRMH